MHTSCLIVAAGRGTRAGGDIPKQYRPVGGKPLLRWSAERLCAHPGIAEVRCVIQPDHRALYENAVAGLSVGEPILGAETRQGSVLAGLEALDEPSHVLIHDAARPFVSKAVVDRLLAALARHDGAIPALPVADSLRRGVDVVEAEIDRTDLHRVQTPQAFHFAPLFAAHRNAAGGATDDAEIARAAGMSVALVEGDPTLFKLTYPGDLADAERLAVSGDYRTGSGFDVHRFESGDHVWLCGVKVPHDMGLKGHSDADAGLHALTDALLGALGEGDIGDHFPPSDPQWAGASSDRFLAHAAQLMRASGGRFVHGDVTLICERPKVGPHREAMRGRIAEILQVPVSAISVKATTTEGLGLTGRREGLAAQAVATIQL